MDEALGLFFRISKALVLGIVMYFSLRGLNFSMGASFAFALVPAVLGAVNILTGPAFMLTGALFIASSSLVLLKETNVKFNPDDFFGVIHYFLEDPKPATDAVAKKPAATAAGGPTGASGKSK